LKKYVRMEYLSVSVWLEARYTVKLKQYYINLMWSSSWIVLSLMLAISKNILLMFMQWSTWSEFTMLRIIIITDMSHSKCENSLRVELLVVKATVRKSSFVSWTLGTGFKSGWCNQFSFWVGIFINFFSLCEIIMTFKRTNKPTWWFTVKTS